MKSTVFVVKKYKCGRSLGACSGSISSITSGRKVRGHEVCVGPCSSSCPLYRLPPSLFYHLLSYTTREPKYFTSQTSVICPQPTSNLIEIWNGYIKYIHIYVYAYIQANTYICMYTYVQYMYLYTHINLYVCIYTYVNYMCLYMYIQLYLCMYIYICTIYLFIYYIQLYLCMYM